MAKAFDKVPCPFLVLVMGKFCFTKVWIQLILNCINYNPFSVALGGLSSGFFSTSRGLRQGILSSLLFIISEEPMSKGLHNLIMSGLDLIRLQANVILFPTYFMQMIVLFLLISKDNLEKIMAFLSSHATSSQQINTSKSNFPVHLSTPQSRRQIIQKATGFSESHFLFMYLGAHISYKNQLLMTSLFCQKKMLKKMQVGRGSYYLLGENLLLSKLSYSLSLYILSLFLNPLNRSSLSWKKLLVIFSGAQRMVFEK